MAASEIEDLQDKLLPLVGKAKDCISKLSTKYAQPVKTDTLIQPGDDLSLLISQQRGLRNDLLDFLDNIKMTEEDFTKTFTELRQRYNEKLKIQIAQKDKDNVKQEFKDFDSNNKVSETLTELKNCIITVKSWDPKFDTQINTLQNEFNKRCSESLTAKSSKQSVQKNVKSKASIHSHAKLSPNPQQQATTNNLFPTMQPQKSNMFSNTQQNTTGVFANQTTNTLASVPQTIVVTPPYQKPAKYHVFKGKASEFSDFLAWLEETFENNLPHWTDAQRGQKLKDSTEGRPHVCVSAFYNNAYRLMKDQLRKNFGTESQIQKELMEEVDNLKRLEKVSDIEDFYFDCFNLVIRLKKYVPTYGEAAILRAMKQKMSERIRNEVKRHLLNPNTQDLDQYQ